jgi:predicted dehydrogenase
MPEDPLSRRSFLETSTMAGAAGAAFSIIKPELVRGAGRERLRAGLVGCGNRGTQAAGQMLLGNDNVDFVAMGDIFEDRLEKSLAELKANPKISGRVKVDPEHHFVSFDAYKKVIASDLDIVMLATPPGYRPAHIEAAVDANKHVFAEKPFGTDPVGVRRVMAAAKKAEERKLTIKSGAQRRSQKEYVETLRKIRDGAIGEIVAAYAWWLGGRNYSVPAFFDNWPGPKGERDPKWGDMEFQHRSWYSYVWLCGDQIVEQHIHNIDVCNWFLGMHPASAVASGGAAWRPRQDIYGNIYDHISTDFIYPNGVHLSSHCRQFPEGSTQKRAELMVGTKGRSNCTDLASGPGINPYVEEHIDLVNSVLGRGPYINEGMAVAESTMTCIMGREAAYSGQEVTWDQMMRSQLDLQPKAFDYKLHMDAPPLPIPGQYKFL